MNSLIDMFFGDNFISLSCDSGECLHYSQVPGYAVSLELLFLGSLASNSPTETTQA